MKTILIMFVAFSLVACGGEPKVSKSSFEPAMRMSENLKDCTIDTLQNSNYDIITVIRCPNSSVSTKSAGKKTARQTVMTISEYNFNRALNERQE